MDPSGWKEIRRRIPSQFHLLNDDEVLDTINRRVFLPPTMIALKQTARQRVQQLNDCNVYTIYNSANITDADGDHGWRMRVKFYEVSGAAMMMLRTKMMAIGYHLWRGERVCGGALHHLLRARGRRSRRVRFQVRARVAFNQVVVKSRPPPPVVGFGGL